MTVVATTGHRPEKLGGHSLSTEDRLRRLAVRELRRLSPDGVISGMALGWDTAIAQAADELGIRFIAAIPFRGQESVWPAESKKRYQSLLAKAKIVVEVSAPPYAAWKMQRRNVWMVDHCDFLLALWDGSDGGTANCLAYAKARQRGVETVWDRWLEAA